MIYLITGVIGASKTLNTIKMLREDKQFKDRPVYYYNIKEVVFDSWIEMSKEDVLKWYELPAGAIIFIDEAQEIFPIAKPDTKKEAPPHITKLNTSRHNGVDLFIISQHPSLIDVRLRRLAAPHYHYERKFGSKMVTQRIFSEMTIDPTDYHAKQASASSNRIIDKKYFGTYKSTELDTHKFNPPKKLLLVILGTIGVIGYAIYFATSLGGSPDSKLHNADGSVLSNDAPTKITGSSFAPVYPLDQTDYLNLYKPRIFGIPSTAPIYDTLTTPVSFPKTLCIRINKNGKPSCSCFTQQASKLIVPDNICNSMIDDRIFDHTIPDQPQSTLKI